MGFNMFKLRRPGRQTVGPDVESISRRYFILGAFDGALTILGVILGAAASGSLTKQIVMSAGIGGGIALAISSAVGAYEAERIENKLNGGDASRMAAKVEHKWPKTQYWTATLIPAAVHGIAPLVAAIIPVMPFLVFDIAPAAMISIALTMAFLFVMGLYLGSLTEGRRLVAGLRFVLIGIVTAVIVVFLFGA
jgi:predicted membrane protein (TIGR00267 family)